MPPASLWIQYSLIGILTLAVILIAAGFYRLWKDLLKWITDQDAKRDIEREKQRIWQAEQDRVRDERWQLFLKSMQDEWIKQDGRHTQSLQELIKKLDDLISDVRAHDAWTRGKSNV